MSNGLVAYSDTGVFTYRKIVSLSPSLTITDGSGAQGDPTFNLSGIVSSVSGTAGRITSSGGAAPVLNIDSAYAGQSSIATVGTLVSGVWNASPISTSKIVGGTVTPASGLIGQRISSTLLLASAVTVTNNTPVNVTSIALTPGIWDISCIGMFNAASLLSSGASRISINSVSATEGVNGVNRVTIPLVALLNSSDLSLVIPALRVEITVNTTYYLVAASSFTLGSCKAYGSISALRAA